MTNIRTGTVIQGQGRTTVTGAPGVDPGYLFGPQDLVATESPEFVIDECPLVLRGFGFEEGQEVCVELVDGCGDEAWETHYVGPLTMGAACTDEVGTACQVCMSACRTMLILPVPGRYRLVRPPDSGNITVVSYTMQAQCFSALPDNWVDPCPCPCPASENPPGTVITSPDGCIGVNLVGQNSFELTSNITLSECANPNNILTVNQNGCNWELCAVPPIVSITPVPGPNGETCIGFVDLGNGNWSISNLITIQENTATDNILQVGQVGCGYALYVPAGVETLNPVNGPNGSTCIQIDLIDADAGTYNIQSLIHIVEDPAVVPNLLTVNQQGCEYRLSVPTTNYADSAAACAADPGSCDLVVRECDLFTWKHAWMHADPAATGGVTHVCWDIALGVLNSSATGQQASVISTENTDVSGNNVNGLATEEGTVTGRASLILGGRGNSVAGTIGNAALGSFNADITDGIYNVVAGSNGGVIDGAGGTNFIGGSAASAGGPPRITGRISSILSSDHVTIPVTSTRATGISSGDNTILNGNFVASMAASAVVINDDFSTAISANDSTINGSQSNLTAGFNITLAGERIVAQAVNNLTTGAGTTFGVVQAGSNANNLALPALGLNAAFSVAQAFEDSSVQADVSMLAACNDCLIAAAAARGSTLLSSAFTIAPDQYTVTGGHAAAGPASPANRTWEIDSVTGTISALAALNVVPPGGIPGFGEVHKNQHVGKLPIGTIVTYGKGNTVKVCNEDDVGLGVVSDTIVFLAGGMDMEDRGDDIFQREFDYEKYSKIEWQGRAKVLIENNERNKVKEGDYIIPGRNGKGKLGGRPGSGWRVVEIFSDEMVLVAIKQEAFKP